jgi:hypothetical protein
VSYFVIATRIDVQNVTSIVHPATWLSDEMRTLAVIDQLGRVVKMTTMAYDRHAVADVVRRLSKLNEKITLDEASARLLSVGNEVRHRNDG